MVNSALFIHHGFRFSFVAVFLLVSTSGWMAQPVPDDSSEIVELDKLVVEAVADDLDADALVIQDLPMGYPGNVTEKLAEFPGIGIVQRGAFSGEPMIRGLAFDRVATTFNGLRLPNESPTRTQAPIGHFGGVLKRSLQVAHFVPSVTLGSPVTGGWIDIENQMTASAGEKTEQLPMSSLQTDLFPDREGIQLSGFNSAHIGPIAYSASVFRNSFGNYTSGDGREVPSRHEDWGGSLSFAGMWGKRFAHSLDTVYRKQLFTENASLPLDIEDGEFRALTATHELRSNESDDWILRLRYGYSESEAFLSNQRRETRPVLVNTETETQAFHTDIRWQTTISTLGNIEMGLDANREKRLAIRQRGPVARDFIWPDIRYEQTGLFIESHSSILDNTTLRVGIRWDYVESEARMADQLAFGKTITSLYQKYNDFTATDVSKSVNALSGNALLRYDPDERITLYAGLGSSAQVPPPTEQYRAFLNALGGGFELGNPTLRPERKWELALGGAFRSEFLTLRLDSYYFQVEDYIWRQQVGTTSGTLPLNPPQSVFSYRNVDAAFMGMEVEGILHVSPSFKIPFSVEWVDAQLSQSGPDYNKGDQLPELPPVEFRISAIWSGEIKSITTILEWALRWTASQSNELPEINPIYSDSDSYCIHDIYLTLRRSDSLSVRLGIRNLFDKHYSPYLAPPISSIRPSSGDLNPGDRVPGAGREAVLSLVLEF